MPPLVTSSSESAGRRPCSDSILAASASRVPVSPRVGAYWKAATSPFSASSATICAVRCRGNVLGSGSPPAKEITSGIAVSASTASMPPPTSPRVRAAKSCSHPGFAVVAMRSTLGRAGEAVDGGDQLFGLLPRRTLVARGERVRDAVPDVGVEDAEREALERGRHGSDLREHVDAVAVVLDHLLDPTHLALDPVQALDERALVGVVTVDARFLGRAHADGAPSVRALRKRRRRRLFVTTKTLEAAIAAAATIGFSSPATASGTAATL